MVAVIIYFGNSEHIDKIMLFESAEAADAYFAKHTQPDRIEVVEKVEQF